MNGISPKVSNGGFVLLYVLWISTAVIAIAFMISQRGRLLIQTETKFERRTLLQSELNSVLKISETMLRNGQLSGGFNFNIPIGHCTVSLADANSRLNINSAEPEEINRLCQRLGFSRVEANTISDSIADWTDLDNNSRPYGAENNYYQSLTPAYPCANRHISEINEMLLIKGIDNKKLAMMENFISFSSKYINLRTAPDEVIYAVTKSDDLAERISQFRKEKWLDESSLKNLMGKYQYEALAPRLTYTVSGVYRLDIKGNYKGVRVSRSKWIWTNKK